MSSVRSVGNRSTEWRLRSALVRTKLKGWKVTSVNLPGKPDFVFPDKKVAIFVDGCFWHGCPQCGRLPKSKKSYWHTKIVGNVKRDKRRQKELRLLGWRVIRIWEHELKEGASKAVSVVEKFISS